MATTIPIPTNNQVLDGSNHFQLPWFMFLLQLATQAASSGDVSQNGSITVGHLAIWAADHEISDGGAIPSGGLGDVIQDGSIVVGDVALFSADKHIEDGGTPSTFVSGAGYWSPLTNGDPVSPELIWDSNGDVIMTWVPA